MDGITIGAVGASIIAGLVSLLGLIISKEQKVSEFRQAWIDDLRKCLVAYIVNINAVCDMLRLKRADQEIDDAALLVNYKLLNEASLGISLRINHDEKTAQELWSAMDSFERLSEDSSKLTPESIKSLEDKFILAAKNLLKFEWNRVKRGETTFVLTKWVITLMLAGFIVLLAIILYTNFGSDTSNSSTARTAELTYATYLLKA